MCLSRPVIMSLAEARCDSRWQFQATQNCLQGGMIVDDELNRLLVNPLAPGVRLHAVIDACHSGTALDLEYRCKVKSSGIHWKMEYAHRPRVYKVRDARVSPVTLDSLGHARSWDTSA